MVTPKEKLEKHRADLLAVRLEMEKDMLPRTAWVGLGVSIAELERLIKYS